MKQGMTRSVEVIFLTFLFYCFMQILFQSNVNGFGNLELMQLVVVIIKSLVYAISFSITEIS